MVSDWANEWTGLLILWRRLYSKGRVLGHKRAKRNSRPNTSLLQIEGVTTKEAAKFYLGKVRLSNLCSMEHLQTTWATACCVRIPSKAFYPAL